ncbi:MAG: hypothetical protein KGL39_34120 [Patescibacteria group bacterium]|nr:hypothetical protein [Patescibacteria group bacterium]
MKPTNTTFISTMLTAVMAAVTLLLAGCVTTPAQQFHVVQLTNTAWGTVYAPLNGTNTTTVSAASGAYNNAGAVNFRLDGFQYVPVYWALSGYGQGTGTSNTVLRLEESPDGTYWVSNNVSITLAMNNSHSSTTNLCFPVTNGTNAFTGYRYGRWTFISTAQTNDVHLQLNQLQAYY